MSEHIHYIQLVEERRAINLKRDPNGQLSDDDSQRMEELDRTIPEIERGLSGLENGEGPLSKMLRSFVEQLEDKSGAEDVGSLNRWAEEMQDSAIRFATEVR